MTREDLTHYPYVSAAHITLSEDTEEEVRADPVDYYTICHKWNATIRGHAYTFSGTSIEDFAVDTGPEVNMTRHGKTAQEAYRTLMDALTEQGWTVS